MPRDVRRWFAVVVVLTSVGGSAWAATEAFYHDDVLGTSLEVIVAAADSAVARRAEEAVLAEIDRLAAICSTYDPASEVSRWLASRRPQEVSEELAAILRACDHWREASHGVFEPGGRPPPGYGGRPNWKPRCRRLTFSRRWPAACGGRRGRGRERP